MLKHKTPVMGWSHSKVQICNKLNPPVSYHSSSSYHIHSSDWYTPVRIKSPPVYSHTQQLHSSTVLSSRVYKAVAFTLAENGFTELIVFTVHNSMRQTEIEEFKHW